VTASEDDVERRVFMVLSGLRSAYDLAEAALALFEERRPAIIGYGVSFEGTGGRRLERLMPGQLEQRAMIGAQAFLSNLVIVEKGVARLLKLDGLPSDIRERAEQSLEAIRTVVDRRVRNTIEHIDERAANAGNDTLMSSTIVEGDMLCSTRDDGTAGLAAITRETLEMVGAAINSIFWTPEEAAAITERLGQRRKPMTTS
jgi:hypothetical protein